MRVSRERQLGLFWGAVALALVAVAPFAPGIATRLPRCFFRDLTGFPCVTCGGVRAALWLFSGDLGSAFRANPLVTAALILLVGGGLAAGAIAVTGRGVREPVRIPGWGRAAAVLVLVANWLWLIVDGR